MVESGSEVSHFIPETRNFAEVTGLSADLKKTWLKATMKEIKNSINNQTFLMDDPDKGDPVTSFMNIYKEKIQHDVSIDKLKLIFVVRGDLHNKEIIGDTWGTTASMITLKYFLAGSANNK